MLVSSILLIYVDDNVGLCWEESVPVKKGHNQWTGDNNEKYNFYEIIVFKSLLKNI